MRVSVTTAWRRVVVAENQVVILQLGVSARGSQVLTVKTCLLGNLAGHRIWWDLVNTVMKLRVP
jgi:hypothetical protein